MQLTKGAIGNLINRYKAVLKKCHLLNVFGSLAVAGMLVMGGAAAAGAVAIHQTTTGTHDYRGENLIYTGTFLFKDPIQAGLPTVRNQVQVNVGDYTTNSITSTGLGGVCALLGGHINLTANSISITSTDTSGSYSALWAQNNSTNSDGIPVDERASITINAENTNIKAANSAIVAMSNGIIEINGNLHVEAQNALLARGDAIISLNKSGESTVGIDGNINFNYDEPTSGTGVNATIDITLNGADSYWNGNTLISWNGTPSDPSKLEVSEMTLTVKDGATWTPTAIQNTTDQKYASLNNLILDNGNIDVNKGVEIAIDKVTGTGFLANEGTVTLTSGALEGRTENAGIINLDPDASISNVTIEQGDANPSAALIAVEADRTTLNGGMATGENATASVAGVAVDTNKNVMITSVDFKNNTFTADRNYPIIGAVTANLDAEQSLTITGSTFANNTVALTGTGSSGGSGGAAVSVKGQGENSQLTILDSTFSGNRYDDTEDAVNGAYGGAIGVQNASVTLNNVTLTGNTGDSGNQVQGGGYYQSVGSLNATQLKVTQNTVTTSSNLMGAGLVLWGTSGSISDSEFTGNAATADGYALGGGLYLRGSRWGGESDLQFNIADTTFSGNSLISKSNDAQGGGLYVKGDEGNSNNGTNDGSGDKNGKVNVNLTDVTFDSNTVNGATASQGGALYVLGVDTSGTSVPANATVTVNNSTFTGNKAEGAAGQGGAIYNAGTLTVSGGEFTGNEAGKYGGAIAGDVEGQGSLNITNATFTGNTSGAGGAIALWSDGIKDAADHAITARFEGNTAERKGGAIVFLANHSGDKTVNASISGEFLNNSAGESGGAIHSERATLTITDATFTGNHATQQGGAIYNAANSSISFSGTNTFTDNTAAEGNDIYNAGSITVADGTTTLGSGLTQVGGKVTVSTGATLDMASGSSLSFKGDNTALTIDGGTFVADFDQLLESYTDTNAANGITGENIIGTSGNLNLRLDGGTYTLDQYNDAKKTLLSQGDESAALNFLNATLQLNDGQNLVVGATPDNGNVTIEMAPVVVEGDQAPSDAVDAGKEIPSVPDQIVSVVAADGSAEDLLPADTIIVSDSKFTAKGLEIAGTAGAEAVTLKVTGSSDITLTGGEAGFTGVVNAENEAVATNVEVSNASLTVGLEGNASAQNLTLNEVKVADGTFAVAGNGLDTTQVEANALVTEGSGTVAVNNATLAVENTTVTNGLLNITNTVADLGTVQATGGVLFFDPSYGNIRSLENDQLGSKLLVSDGSVVNVASGLDNLQELAQKAGFTTTATGSGEFTLGAGQSMLAVGQPIQLTSTGQIVVDAGVDASGQIDSRQVNAAAYFGNNSLLVVNGNTINGTTTAAITLDGSNQNLNVQNGAKLLIADAVAGQTYTVIANADNADTAFNGTSYTNASATGWKDANLLTSSDMVTLTSEDGTVFKSASADAHTVFPNLSHELATAVNTLYGQQLNDVDADAMGVRFLSRATDNRYLGADKQAAASTIESAARMAFAGAVPQMTKMASDAGTNAVVNRLGFANPADGAQAMNAEGKIVDRNTTGFALWIAPLWQNQHGWGMEAGNLDYGFNGNLGGVSLGADYTFENAIRAGITFNIGGGYAESSGGDLNSTENRMTFWGLGAYAGWNYENFGLMADVSYTSTWNDLEQDMDGRMGMGDLEADVQATAISAGLRAEYKLETSVLDIIPHIGVRYMSLNTWGYDVDTNGGTVLEGDGFHQDIWTFPIGVTFSKDFTLDSGWFFKPSVDFSVIPAAGDIKAKQDVAFTGLPGTYEVETQMMDYLTWQGGVGIQMGNDNLSFGVNYTLQAGQNTTGHGVFGSFRYEF